VGEGLWEGVEVYDGLSLSPLLVASGVVMSCFCGVVGVVVVVEKQPKNLVLDLPP
jgi:hypothetical protein